MKEQFLNYWNIFSKWSPLIVVVLFLLLVFTCDGAREDEGIFADNMETLDSPQKTIKLKNDEIAHQKRLLIVTERQFKKQLLIKDDTIALLLKQVKNPTVLVKWKTRVVFDTIFIPYSEPVPFEFSRTFNKEHQWYSLSGVVNQFGVKLNPPSFPNEQRLLIGYVNGNPTATITNSNPFIVTEDMEGQIINIPKKRWTLGGGVVAIPIHPYVMPGIYIGRTFVRF